MNEHTFELQDVTKIYAGRQVLHIPRLNVRSGEILAIVGPSGAGKSTILQLLYRKHTVDGGRILFSGRDISRLTERSVPFLRRNLGVVFQDFRLLDHLSTYENVALPLRVIGKEESSYRTDVIELLHWVGLGHRVHVHPPVLSGGEKQRAAIARAVITQPELLLADEPTGNVDPQMARRLLRLFIELNRLGTSVIIATHDYQLMTQFPAPRLVLDKGSLSIHS